MKKIISIFLALILAFSLCVFANAESADELRFGSDGKFTVLQISDPQDDHYPAYDMVNLIKISIEQTNPDLIVFTGDIVEDNRAGDIGSDGEILREGVEVDGDYEQTLANVTETCKAVFAEAEARGIPFAVAQGNNDYGSGVTNEDWFKIYNSYKYSLTADESKDADGRIDFNLEIKGKNGETVLNIWMMDNGGGSITEEQLAWYKSESAALKEANGGKTVPSILFQHVPVDDIGNLFEKCNFWDEGASIADDGKYYRLNQEIAKGYHAGAVIPGSESEQFKAWTETGDVMGAYFGHWHTEGYTGTWKGIELGMTYGCEFTKPGPYGVRVFTFDENDIDNYENELYTYEGSVKKGNARLELQVDEPYAVYDNAIEEFFAGIANVFALLYREIMSLFA